MSDAASPFYVSASQIETYREECQQKWYQQSVLKIKPPQKPAAAFGDACHAVLEAYLKTGTPPDIKTRAGKLMLPALKHFPTPSPRLVVEGRFQFERDGILYVGREDCVDPDTTLTIYDLKTTSAEKWIKTEDELRENVQAIMYGMRAHLKWGVERVRLKWVYVLTDGSGIVVPISLELDLTTIRNQFTTIQRDAEAMKLLASQPVESARKNELACESYGGCFFRNQCWGDQVPVSIPVWSESPMPSRDLLAELKAKTAAKPAPAEPSAPAANTDAPLATATVPGAELSFEPTPVLPPDATLPVEPPARAVVEAKRGKKAAPSFTSDIAPPSGEIISVAKASSLILCIDCAPLKGFGAPTLLAEVIAPLAKSLAAELAVPDVRLVPYGQGNVQLAVRFEQWIEENPLSGVVYANSYSPESKPILDVLSRYADVIFQGR